MELHLPILVVLYLQRALSELLTYCRRLQIKLCNWLRFLFLMTCYFSSYEVLDFLKILQLLNENIPSKEFVMSFTCIMS